MLEHAAGPRFRTGLASRRDGPEAPDALAGRGAIRVEEAARAFVTAGVAGDHKIVHDEGSARGAVVLPVVGHFRVPEQLAGAPIESDQVGIVRGQEDAASEHRYTA